MKRTSVFHDHEFRGGLLWYNHKRIWRNPESTWETLSIQKLHLHKWRCGERQNLSFYFSIYWTQKWTTKSSRMKIFGCWWQFFAHAMKSALLFLNVSLSRFASLSKVVFRTWSSHKDGKLWAWKRFLEASEQYPVPKRSKASGIHVDNS